jgi:predicted transcriptional regulator
MGVLWREPEGELTARQVADELPDHAYTTVATVLDRLTHKGRARRRRDGRVIRFRAVGTRAFHTVALMRQALDDSGDPAGALIQFVDAVSPAEARILRRALEAHRTGHRAGT